MKTSQFVTIVLWIAIFLVFGSVWFLRFLDNIGKSSLGSKNSSPTNSNVTEQATPRKDDGKIDYGSEQLPDRPLANQIYFKVSGFEPTSLSVPKGSIITFFNESTGSLTLDGPNVESVKVGVHEKFSLGFNQAGSFSYKSLSSPESPPAEITVF